MRSCSGYKCKFNLNKRGYAIAEVSCMYGIKTSSVFKQIYLGKLFAYTIGSKTIIPFEALMEWEMNNRSNYMVRP